MSSRLFDQLMRLSREQFTRQHFEVAYHLLAASLHVARDERDAQGVRSVQREAQVQISWLDSHVASHQLATHAATHRGTQTLWHSLVLLCDSMLVLLERLPGPQG